jgi:two-component system, sensor histidine kinase PdtaS
MKIRLLLMLVIFSVEAFGQSGKIDSLRKALLKKPNDIDINLMLSKQYLYSNPDSAFYFATKVLQIGDKKYFSQGYDLIGNTFVAKGKYDSARFYYTKAMSYVDDATNQNKEHNIMGRLLNMSQLSSLQNKVKNALDTLNIVEEAAIKFTDAEEKAKDLMIVYSSKASIYSSIGLADEAVMYAYKAIKMTQDAKNENGEVASWNRLGRIFTTVGKFDKAIETARNGLVLSQKNKNILGLANAYHSISNNFLNLDKIDSAIYYNYLFSEICLSNKSNIDIARDYKQKGEIYFKQKLFNKSLESFLNSLAADKGNNLSLNSAVSYAGIGKNYVELNKYDSAIKYFNKALPSFISEEQKTEIKSTKFKLLEAQLKKENRSDLLDLLNAYDTLNQQQFSEAKIKSLTAQEIKYETSLKEATIANQVNQLSNERKQKYWLYGGIGSLALVIGGLGYFYNRIKKQKAQIQNQKFEILHNNRNNIQQLISIFSRQAETEGLKENSIANQERLFTLNLLNKLLYENGEANQANVQDYLNQLCSAKQISAGNFVQLNVSTPSIILKSNLLKDIGLIVNELTTNAIKYAATNNDKPTVTIDVKTVNDEFINLLIKDNGQGFPTDFNLQDKRKSFGLEFVNDLVIQHHGNIKAYNDGGGCFDINLKLR